MNALKSNCCFFSVSKLIPIENTPWVRHGIILSLNSTTEYQYVNGAYCLETFFCYVVLWVLPSHWTHVEWVNEIGKRNLRKSQTINEFFPLYSANLLCFALMSSHRLCVSRLISLSTSFSIWARKVDYPRKVWKEDDRQMMMDQRKIPHSFYSASF